MQTKIYCLCDENSQIRYIGKTGKELEQRLYEHIKEARGNKKKSNKNIWIRSMLNKNLLPTTFLIGEVCGNGNKEEIAFIQYGKEQLWTLTNGTLGGDGGEHTEETKQKMKLSRLNYFIKHPEA